MNSVAVPATAHRQTPSAEAELVRSATRGDADAFGELFRRHGQPAWRLAQAVAPSRDSAAVALRDGFGRAARSRRTANAGGAFRLAALAAVYRAALEQAQDPAAAPSPARRARDAESALAAGAFRSLPERWRAALWLSDAEGMEVEPVAAVLGVSVAVAGQLVTRGRKGLAGRYAQARRAVPDHPGEVLRGSAMAMPADLAESAQSRWAEMGHERTALLSPLASWIEGHATRPASVAVGTLVGLGLIGLGVIPGGSAVRSQFGSNAAGKLNGAVPVQTCLGLPCAGNTSSAGLRPAGSAGPMLTALGAANPFDNASTTSSLSQVGGGAAGSSDVGTASPGSAPGAAPTQGGTGSVALTSGGGGTTGGGSTGGAPSTGGASTGSGGGGTDGGPPAPSPTTTTTVAATLNLAPVATVTNSGSSLNVTLLPTSPASTTVSVPLATSASTTTTTVAPTTPTTTPPTTPLSGTTNAVTGTVSGVANTVTGTLSGVTNDVTGTATTLLPGL